MAIRWMSRFVDPPVAFSPTIPLTNARSSSTSQTGVYSLPSAEIASARFAPSTVSASRSGVPGLTKLAPGRCSPMNSISIWLVFAVP